jgi:L-ectoine synthase
MIIRNYNDAKNSPRKVEAEGWTSVRLLLKDDKMGFSFHITTIHEGAELPMHYQNHLESVYCMSGKGSIENKVTGEVREIGPGTMYALDQNDPHILRAEQTMQMACVFNPPLTGLEVHDASGAYPLEAEAV